MAYSAYIAQVKDVKKDENSENLYIAQVMEEGVIVGSDMQEGELVLYMPADGAVERWFGDKFSLFRKNEDGTAQGGYLENTGQIKALKLRGLRSEGIAISLNKLLLVFPELHKAKAGDELTTLGGAVFIKKYIPRSNKVVGQSKTSMKGKKRDGIKVPLFAQHIDTKQLMYNEDAFREGDILHISLKMHGTSQRSMNTYAELPNGFFRRLFHMKPKTKQMYVLGTRRTVILDPQKNGGFYGNDSFRVPHHERIKPFIEEGQEIFYEIVGFTDGGAPIMPTCDNKLLKDKAFQKQFGTTTTFSYGCEPGTSEMYVYRITSNNGEKEWSPSQIEYWCNQAGVKMVPQVEVAQFTTWKDLTNRVNRYLEVLADPVGKTHIKEGVVVRILNRENFAAYKAKSFQFKVLEQIIKEVADAPDMEEQQEV